MDPVCLATRAPAKINLTLHITERRLDGWHELVSLVAFAGVGDHVRLIPDRSLILVVDGPTGALTGPDEDNLVLRAARSLAARVNDLRTGEFRLYKRLPVASGMGGGSSDAAAALRLLAQLNGMSPLDHRLIDAARSTGADVPVCLDAKARVMQGTGEQLGPILRLPPLFAVLVNPAVGLETKRVFARMGLQPGSAGPGGPRHPTFSEPASFDGLLQILGEQRNDMEAAAEALLPVIGEQLQRLAAESGCRLARMSGSGATCFGIFTNRHNAAAAARALQHARPDWWVCATILH